jgi:hypothetical protein
MKITQIFVSASVWIFLMLGTEMDCTANTKKKALENQLNSLEKETITSQESTLELLDLVADNLSSRLRIQKKALRDGVGIKDSLSISKARLADIEKARARLKRDIEEWTSMIDYTEISEVKQGIETGLAIAEADGMDVDRLTRLYNMSKNIIRNSAFRSSVSTPMERMKNIDLDRADTDRHLIKLGEKWEGLQARIEDMNNIANPSFSEIWARENLKADQLAVEAEIVQHQLNIRHEDVSRPMTILMDGILSGLLTLNNLTGAGEERVKTSGLEKHGFDWGAPREMMENYTTKILTLGFLGEELAAEAAAERQKRRKNFYKRASISYIRALISGKEQESHCPVENMIPVVKEFNGEQIRTLGCPDPVVDNLRAYLDVFKKFQDADTDRLVSEGEQLVAEQQIIADFLAVVPLVGEALDIYAVYSGENIAGLKLSPIERGFIGVAAAIPIIGPHAFNQAYTRSAAFKAKMEAFGEYFVAVARLAEEVSSSLKKMGKEAYDEFLKLTARKMGIEVDQLKRMMLIYREAPYVLDEAAKNRMKLFKTMRDASEDRIYVSLLATSEELAPLYRQARADSDRLVLGTIRNKQGLIREEIEEFISHMPDAHKKAFLELAQEQRQVYVFRPIGKDAAEKIAADFAATKGLGIKPKSATWGPQKSFIPVEQEFSKLGKPGSAIDYDKIAKFNAKAKACLDSVPPCARAVPLKVKIPGEAMEVEVIIVKQGAREMPVYRNSNGVLIDPDTMRPFKSGEVDITKMRKLEVFADANGTPLTADYDLLAVGMTRQHHVASTTSGAGFDTATRKKVVRFAGDEGNISPELSEVVKRLNKAAREKGGYTKGKLVHHGPDTYNPMTEGVFTKTELEDRLALTVIDPDYGELAIPACTVDCMRNWCMSTGMCSAAKVCTEGKITNCIPVDPDRLLKDYFHNARLRNIDISPHSSWGWGNYNGLSGWTQTSFLKVPSEVAESATGKLAAELMEQWKQALTSSIYRRVSAPSRVNPGRRNNQ